MNIFYLSPDPKLCAQYLCDSHVRKMTLETTQMLCTTINICGGIAPYRSSHVNHPSTIWTRQSLWHFGWMLKLGCYLSEEFTYRFDKTHKCRNVLYSLWIPLQLWNIPFKPPPQCMPDQYKMEDTVEAYRAYYQEEKSHLFKWTRRDPPTWLLNPNKTERKSK